MASATANPRDKLTMANVEDINAKQNISFPGPPSTFLRTLWLFSYSDLPILVFPVTCFGILAALSGPQLTTNPSPNTYSILLRTPLVALFAWLNVLVLEVANQRLPESIIEDRHNKPWRPIPSGRLTPTQARHFLIAIMPVVMAITYTMGVWKETALLYSLDWMYNDLNGADDCFIVRDMLNSVAFAVYHMAALRVACGLQSHTPNNTAFTWIGVISGAIFCTVNLQDMKDQEGDAAKGRKTAPLVIGDGPARWNIAGFTTIWSLVCVFIWDVNWVGCVLPMAVSSLIAVRVLYLRDRKSDHNTFLMWSIWLLCLYILPALKECMG